MRVLVTGGAGFIGGALVSRLVGRGDEVVVADLRPVGPGSADLAGVVTGDLRDPDVADKALAAGTDVVMHLAAATSVLRSVEAPADVYRSNVALTQHLLERCRQLGVGSFVLASTNAAVGSGAGGGVIDERSPLAPLTPYGATKAAAEMLVSAYRNAYGMAAASLRLTNVYGPGVWVKDGLVARLFKAARSGEGIRINGDGLQVRDYVYLDDVVDAFLVAGGLAAAGGLSAVGGGRPGPAGEPGSSAEPGAEPAGGFPATVVIGSGVSVNVLELHQLVAEVTGVGVPAEHVAPPAGEMQGVVVDRGRADSIGLGPPVQLPAGLAATWLAWPAD